MIPTLVVKEEQVSKEASWVKSKIPFLSLASFQLIWWGCPTQSFHAGAHLACFHQIFPMLTFSQLLSQVWDVSYLWFPLLPRHAPYMYHAREPLRSVNRACVSRKACYWETLSWVKSDKSVLVCLDHSAHWALNSCSLELNMFSLPPPDYSWSLRRGEKGGLSAGSDTKVSDWNVEELGSVSGSWRSPAEGNGNPLQYSSLENPMDGGA